MSQPSAGRASAGKGQDAVLHVVVTGAQLLFSPLLLAHEDLESIRSRLRRALRGEDGWVSPVGSHPEAGSYASGGGLADRTRPVLCVRKGLLSIDGADGDVPEHWEFAEATLVVSNTGAATVRAEISVRSSTDDVSRASAADDVKRLLWLREPADAPSLSAVPTAIDEFFQQSRQQLDQALAEQHIDPTWSVVGDSDGDERQLGRLLWLHPVYLVEAESADPVPTARALSSVFISSEVAFRGGVLSAGIGRSAIVRTSESENDVADVLDLLELHWTVFATFLWLDDHVRRRLEIDGHSLAASRRELSAASERAFDLYAASRRIVTDADSVLASLGGDMTRVWDTIADVQSTARLLDGVDRKLTLLREIAERRARDAAQYTARRTETALAMLSLLSSITVVIAIATFLIGDLQAQTGDAILRIWTLLAAAAGCVALAIAVLGLRTRFPGTATRPRKRREPPKC